MIGIIGFGQMAQFMTKHLRQRFDIVVSDVIDRSPEAKALDVNFVPLQEAASQDVVILAVPIDKVRECMQRIRRWLRPGCLLMDICSVKMRPVAAMLELAPPDVEVLGTHPLFGPQSGKNGIEGLKIVLCPARTMRLEEVKSFCESLGLQVIVCTPQEHDQAMAQTQALEHFIGRALINMDAKEGMITTPTFKHLMALKESFKDDSLELFACMETENLMAAAVRKQFMEELERIESTCCRSKEFG